MPRRRSLRRTLRRVTAVAALALALQLASVPALVHAEAVSSFKPVECQAYTPSSVPDDADWAQQRLRLEKAHQLATGAGVTIAVIDTGVSPIYSDYFRPGQVSTMNTAPNKVSTKDKQVDCLHGTGVVSLIAAQPGADPKVPFAGVAPDAHILAIRALEDSPDNAGSNGPQNESLGPTIEAIDYAIAKKVDIISISQQGSDIAPYRAAIEKALSHGIVVVAAAGNHGASSQDIYPAAYPGVIAVGMTNSQDLAPADSQHAPELHVSVAAPGEDVLMLEPSGELGQAYRTASGTSFAAPLVAGAAALLLEQHPQMTPAEVKARLQDTADPPAKAVPDPQLGWGIVDPYRALTDPMVERKSAPPSPERQTPTDPPGNPFDRPTPDHTARNIALALGGAALLAVCLTAVIAASLPAGRRRGWRPHRRRHD